MLHSRMHLVQLLKKVRPWSDQTNRNASTFSWFRSSYRSGGRIDRLTAGGKIPPGQLCEAALIGLGLRCALALTTVLFSDGWERALHKTLQGDQSRFPLVLFAALDAAATDTLAIVLSRLSEP